MQGSLLLLWLSPQASLQDPLCLLWIRSASIHAGSSLTSMGQVHRHFYKIPSDHCWSSPRAVAKDCIWNAFLRNKINVFYIDYPSINILGQIEGQQICMIIWVDVKLILFCFIHEKLTYYNLFMMLKCSTSSKCHLIIVWIPLHVTFSISVWLYHDGIYNSKWQCNVSYIKLFLNTIWIIKYFILTCQSHFVSMIRHSSSLTPKLYLYCINDYIHPWK